METVKGLADVVQHLLYEMLGLLFPGALAVLAIAAALGLTELQAVLRIASQYTLLAIAGAYVAGYVVQGMSRPVNQLAEDILTVLPKLVLKVLGKRTRKLIGRVEKHLTGRHSHVTDAPDEHTAALDALIADYWAKRLGLPGGKRLRADHVRDLCFSEILDARGHLDRFRAATSLCRGAAFSVVMAAVILIAQLALGDRPLTLGTMALMVGLLVTFYALTERADMYHGLWKAVVPTQFLARVSRNGSLELSSGAAGAPTPERPLPGAIQASTPRESSHAS